MENYNLNKFLYSKSKNNSMTICITAIATDSRENKNSEFLVFCTDHMVTTSLGQFEQQIKKYKKINNAIAMLSGRILIFDKCLKGLDLPTDFNKGKEKIFENMKNIRKETIQNEVYNVFNVDEEYAKNLLKEEVKNTFIGNILDTVSKYSLETSILLIGFDENGSAQISEISEDGIDDFRDIQFHAIGSGSIQALNTLLFQRQSKAADLKTTLYNIFKAKKNAEVAQGVGKETELLILKNDGNLIEISQGDLTTLNDVYNTELTYGKRHTKLNSLNANKLI